MRQRRQRRPWTTKEILMAMQLGRQGWSSQQVGQHLGRTPASVRMMWHRRGIHQRPRWTPEERAMLMQLKGLPGSVQCAHLSRTLEAIRFQRYWLRRKARCARGAGDDATPSVPSNAI